jgi:adenosylmethionine-8-amino-7-oxononanoate aminotransferase
MSSSRHEELRDLDRRHLIHPITEFRKQEQGGSRIIVGGKGVRVETSDGRTAIDGFSGLFNINVGHGRTEIGDAVHAQMQRLAYYPSFYDVSNEPSIRLAERLAGLFPADRGLDRFLFTSGGSDANETNFRLARLYHCSRGDTGRAKVLSRRSSFHGITRAAGSATTLPAYHVFADRDPLHLEVAAPYCLRCEFGKERSTCGLACAEDLGAVVAREGPETISAIVAEPIQGTGGIILPPTDYFTRLQEICREHGILLILDEVITGFGRTGKWFGMEHFGIEPDLVSFAKGVTSGYLPLGGVAVRNEVYETIRDQSPPGLPFMGGLTYNNHPAACTAALANLDIIEGEGLVENARRMGTRLRDALESRLGAHPFVREIRGFGLLAAIECAQPGSLEPVGGRPMVFTSAVSHQSWDRGLIARALWETVALAPPLCITPAEVDEVVDILGAAFDAAAGDFS